MPNNNMTFTINDPNNALSASVKAAMMVDLNYVANYFSTYIAFAAPLNMVVNVQPFSSTEQSNLSGAPGSGALVSWVTYQGKETNAAIVKGQTGIEPAGVTQDGGFLLKYTPSGQLLNYGSPFWFDPNPQLGVAPNIPAGSTDFVSVAIHELTHCLGFASWPAQNAPWNQHIIQQNGVWEYTSPAISALVGGNIPTDPNEWAPATGDHIGNTSIAYQPVQSDLMFEWGNYAGNRWEFGQVDLTILSDLGYKVQNYANLPLTDPIDSANIDDSATKNDLVIQANVQSSIVKCGSGNDTVVIPKASHTGNYFIIGGGGADTLSISDQSANYVLVAHGTDFLLQCPAGNQGVSLLRSIQIVAFSDETVALNSSNSGVVIAATQSNASLNVGAGRDILIGGAGADTAVFHDGIANYTISNLASGALYVTDNATNPADGPVVLDGNFTSLKFADGTIAEPTNSAATASIVANSANVSANIDALNALAETNKITSITLSDDGVSALSLTAAQVSADNAALGAITGYFTINAAAGSASATISNTTGHGETLTFSGSASQYTITPTGNGTSFTISNGTITDLVSGVQALQFADFKDFVAQTPVTTTVTTGNVTELYGAAFGRLPDVPGLAYYQSELQANPNIPLTTFAQWFLQSPEYVNNSAHNYAQTAAGDARFISDLYNNLLHRAPGAADAAWYEANVIDPFISGLTPGTSAFSAALALAHAYVVTDFSQSAEFLNNVQITAQHAAGPQYWLVLI